MSAAAVHHIATVGASFWAAVLGGALLVGLVLVAGVAVATFWGVARAYFRRADR